MVVEAQESLFYPGFLPMFDSSNLGKISNLTNIFQMGWNHQLVMLINHPPRAPTHVRCLVSSPSLTALDLHRGPCDTTAAAGHATVSRPGDFGRSWGGQFGVNWGWGAWGIEFFCWVLGVVEVVGFGFGPREKRSGKNQWSYLIWYEKTWVDQSYEAICYWVLMLLQ